MQPINVEMSFDGSAVTKGTAEVSKGIDEVATSAKKAGTAGDDLGDSIRSGGTKAERALDDVKRAAKDSAETIEDSSERAGNALGDNIADGADKAESATGGLKGAVGDVAGAFSELDGTAEGALDAVGQGIGAIAGVIPGVGAAVGVLASEAIPLIGEAFGAAGKAAQEMADETDDAFQQMLSSETDYLTQDSINKNIADITGDTEKYNAAVADATALGLDASVVIRAQAGDLDAMATVQARVTQLQNENADAAVGMTDKYGHIVNPALAAHKQQLDALEEKYGKQSQVYKDASDRFDVYTKAVNDSTAAHAAAAPVIAQTADQIQRVTDKTNAVPETKTVKVDADTSVFESKLDRLINNAYFIPIEVQYTRNGVPVY